MCMADSADSYASVHNVFNVKAARKEHTCSECRRVIAKGEAYRRDEMVIEGGWYHFQTCAHCQVACNWLAAQCGGWLHEGVLEDIEEHTPVYRLARLYRIQIGMNRGWKRFDGKGLMQPPALPQVIEKVAA